jgi:hypothetical protein
MESPASIPHPGISDRAASAGQNQESPAEKLVRARAMITVKNKRAQPEFKRQLPEDFSATDFDIVRMRALSNQI